MADCIVLLGRRLHLDRLSCKVIYTRIRLCLAVKWEKLV